MRREAEDLIAEFGAEAWHEAQDRAAARSLEDVGADPHPWCVARAVERRLGIRHQPDTATRSLL
ncbi:MAG: hypothetical protein KDA73_10450 [Rhodobacteraceae bacterium]|nr:hypothetical protein [Paracoccaceae bacterium]